MSQDWKNGHKLRASCSKYSRQKNEELLDKDDSKLAVGVELYIYCIPCYLLKEKTCYYHVIY